MSKIGDRFLDFIIPKHSEVTLYIIAVGFAITYMINPEDSFLLGSFFSPNLFSKDTITMPIVTIMIAIFIIFYPKKIPGFHSLFAPLFISASSFMLALEYFTSQLTVTESINKFSFFLAVYHLAMATALKEIKVSEISKRISNEYKTPISSIILVNIIIVSVFSFFYFYETPHSFSWAIPITTSLFIWQIIDGFIIKGSRIEAPTTV